MNDLLNVSSISAETLPFLFWALILFLVICPLVLIIAIQLIFTKAGKPGWAILIPIYSGVVYLDIIGQRWTRLLWYCIPVCGFYLSIVDIEALSKSFGKGTGFTLGLILLSPIFVCILGFGGAQYLGVVNEGEDQSAFLQRLNNGLNKENEDLKRKVAQLQKQLEPQAQSAFSHNSQPPINLESKIKIV